MVAQKHTPDDSSTAGSTYDIQLNGTNSGHRNLTTALFEVPLRSQECSIYSGMRCWARAFGQDSPDF